MSEGIKFNCWGKQNYTDTEKGLLKRLLYTNFVLCGSKAIGILAPITIPPLHIAFLYYFWQEYSRDVDKQYCSCSCWDTVFKGSYESGIASYKHMYFNATTNSLKIWITVVIGIVTFYETVKYLIWLAFQQRLRLNKKNPITHRKTFGIVAIAILHIVAGGSDQFIANVVRGEGYAHQVVRDLGFMIPDILHVAVPLWSMQWKNAYNLPGSSTRDPSIRRDLAYMLGMILIGLCVCTIL
ncbi:hypothetical protein KPH14_003722 [Odynerus spinipes]|uniref:Uncharacterized protein n=1 Tax=Odynerus spinipes TaxID=1348599 RepID=A0AAD9RXJ2_9HYME|nr:hypothetical protein KPH14_003722 [Odynerus spinipes]